MGLVVCIASTAAAASAAQRASRPAASTALRLDVQPDAAKLVVQLRAADLQIAGVDGRDVVLHLDQPAGARVGDEVSLARDANGRVRVASARQAPSTSHTLRFRLLVPRAMMLEDVQLDAGRLTLEGLTGRVSARVVRGAIEANGLGGRVRLEVDTGDILARAVRLVGGGSLKCRTFNGNVRVELAQAPVDARVLALTLNGAVASSLPLTTRSAFGPRFAEATFGDGTHVLSIDVVRGDITIDVRRSSVR